MNRNLSLFFVIALLAAFLFVTVKPVSATPVFTGVSYYAWWPGDGNYSTTNFKVGDHVMAEFNITNFTYAKVLYVKAPDGTSLPFKNSTATQSPFYVWFNLTSLQGTYTIVVNATDTATNTSAVYTGTVVANPYSITTMSLKVRDIDGNLADPYTLYTLSGEIAAAPVFFSKNYNGSITLEGTVSVATPFKIQVVSGSTVLYDSGWIHPKGSSYLSKAIDYIISDDNMALLGYNNIEVKVVPYVSVPSAVASKAIYFIPAEDFTVADLSVNGTVASTTLHVGDTITVNGIAATISSPAKTLVGGDLALPMVFRFVSASKTADMYPVDSNGHKLVFIIPKSSTTSISASKFLGDLPTLGDNTLKIFPITLSTYFSDNYNMMVDKSGKYVGTSSSVTVLPDGTFSIKIVNSTNEEPEEVHPTDTIYANVTWSRNGYWIYKGDSYSINLMADTEMAGSVYHKGYGTITAANDTQASVSIKLEPFNKTYVSLVGSAIPKLYVKYGTTTSLLASGSAVSYKFAGYNIEFTYNGQPYTPPSGIPIELSFYENGVKIYSENVTSSAAYFYSDKGPITVKAVVHLNSITTLEGSANLAGEYGSVTNVVVPLSTKSISVGPYEYVPKDYTGKISVAIKASLQPDVTYKLYNNLTAESDPVANSPDVTITWDDAAHTVATVLVSKAGDYIITYDASGTYENDKPIAVIKDTQGNVISEVKLKLISDPGYYVRMDPISGNEIKIYVVKGSGAMPLVIGKNIQVDVNAPNLVLVKAVNATRVNSWSDYSWYITPGGYVVYKIPSGGAGQDVLVNVTMTVPTDLSPAISEYDWTTSVAQVFKVAPGPTIGPIAGVSGTTLLVVVALLLIALGVYFAIREKS